ncbi:mechanosensitive ion channel family protein [Euzebya sp.]|uniref:mechanosensitive ion channel family protein n=1 Tax=Euzebya sp. TaxID=1971409 RepID=UPI003519234D
MPEDTVVEAAVDVVASLAVMGGAVVLAVLLSVIAGRVLFRVSKSDAFARELSQRGRWPARVLAVLVGLLAAMPATELPEALAGRLTHILLIGAIVAGAWTLLRLAVAIEVAMLDYFVPTGTEEQAEERRIKGRQTQVIILRRVASGVIILVTIGAVMLTFESARTVGTSLLASAGVLGLVLGIAAQPTLGNLVAGIQLAVAEPLSIDDVVTVEGEWGNIEEITLTYVVIVTWDRRRLVLPTSYFVNTPFTNWSRRDSQVIGSVVWHLDHRTPVPALRAAFHQRVERSEEWDGDVAALQVIDTTPTTIQVRATVTAQDSIRAWNLRCKLREELTAWLAATHPESLPTTRLVEGAPSPTEPPGPVDPTLPLTIPGPGSASRPDPVRTGEWPVV